MCDETSTSSVKDYAPVVGGCLLSISLDKPIRQKKTPSWKPKPPAVKVDAPCKTAEEHIDRARALYGEDVIDPDGKISHTEADIVRPAVRSRNWFFTLPGTDDPPALKKGVDYLAFCYEEGLWKCLMRNYGRPVHMPYVESLGAEPVTAKVLQALLTDWTAKTTFVEDGKKPLNHHGGSRWDKRRQYVMAVEEERLGDIPPRQKKKMLGKDNVPTQGSVPTTVHNNTYNAPVYNITNYYAGNGENNDKT